MTRDHLVTYPSPVSDDDLVFKALADPTRRRLLDRLFARDGRTLSELEADVAMTRFGVMNSVPPPVAALPTSEQSFAGETGVPLDANGTVQLIPADAM